MKTELFEKAGMTASIYQALERALGSLGITRGPCLYVFFLIEYRLSNIEFRTSQCFRVDGEILGKRSSCGRGSVITRIKKMCFQKRSGYV